MMRSTALPFLTYHVTESSGTEFQVSPNKRLEYPASLWIKKVKWSKSNSKEAGADPGFLGGAISRRDLWEREKRLPPDHVGTRSGRRDKGERRPASERNAVRPYRDPRIPCPEPLIPNP